MPHRILVVDDETSMCELLVEALSLRGFDVTCQTNAADALRAVRDETFDAVLTDVKMPRVSGIELCEQIATNRPDLPVVVMTAFGSMETAVAALRAGAYDFITKPIETDLLVMTLERAVRHGALQDQVKRLSEQVEMLHGFGDLLGESEAMRGLYDQLRRVSGTEASILITGESGTGKELVARSIHANSPRSNQPFVAINCAALPETLLESELFGHARGAFTDARADRRGLFAQAEHGTVFLDEIGEMPQVMQAKLLRVLEDNRIRPVGAEREIDIDVRLLTATHRDLESEVEEGRFREDLFFRVNVIKLEVPPLRARHTDVLLLAQHFVEMFAARLKKPVTGISPQAAERLLEYAWPGNVRELKNIIERGVALTSMEQIAVEDLPEKIQNYRSSQVVIGGESPTELVSMEEVERRYVLHVIEAVGGNKSLAARILGFDRKTLYRKLKQYGVDV